jgi:hypothetical protein
MVKKVLSLSELKDSVSENKEDINGLKAMVKSQTSRAVIKQIKNEINEVTKLRKSEQKMSGITIEKHEITKLLIVSIAIPLISAAGIIISNFMTYKVLDWTPILIALNAVSIPTVISWLNKKFDKKDLSREKEISDLKSKHNKELIAKNDQINAMKINYELAKVQGVSEV